MNKYFKAFLVAIVLQTLMFTTMEFQLFQTRKDLNQLTQSVNSFDILNQKIADYIIKVNPKVSADSARLIGDLTIKECNGDLRKISVALAIFHTESHFMHSSVSEKDAKGIGQNTAIAYEEYKLRTKRDDIDPKTLEGNIKLTIWGLDNIKTRYVKRNYPDGIYAFYNGGKAQYQRLVNGQPIAKETKNYVIQVKERQSKLLTILRT